MSETIPTVIFPSWEWKVPGEATESSRRTNKSGRWVRTRCGDFELDRQSGRVR
jgi:hypothetical protein